MTPIANWNQLKVFIKFLPAAIWLNEVWTFSIWLEHDNIINIIIIAAVNVNIFFESTGLICHLNAWVNTNFACTAIFIDRYKRKLYICVFYVYDICICIYPREKKKMNGKFDFFFLTTSNCAHNVTIWICISVNSLTVTINTIFNVTLCSWCGHFFSLLSQCDFRHKPEMASQSDTEYI